MMNLLIVDDELKVCQLIEKLVPWDELGLNPAGMAHNGMDALELVKKGGIDLVLTDIRMPGMDGIELIKRAKEAASETAFIIVSGHRDFEYAQSALKSGALDYLLKPIGREELKKTLSAAIESRMASSRRLSHEADLEDELEKKTALMNEHWLALQYEKGFDLEGETIESIQASHGVALSEGNFRVVAGKLDLLDREKLEPEFIRNIMEKITGVFSASFAAISETALFIPDGLRLVGLVNGYKNQSINKTLFEGIYEKINMLFLAGGRFHFTTALGRQTASLDGLAQSYRSAWELLEARVAEGPGRVYSAEYMHRSCGSPEGPLLPSLSSGSQLVKALETFDMDRIRQALGELFREYEKDDASRCARAAMMLSGEVLDALWHALSLLGLHNSMEDFRPRAMLWLDNAIHYSDIKSRLAEEVEAIVAAANESKTIQEFRPIRLAKQYIEENYMQAIVLEDIAEVVGLNPVYFSVLFKRETGENFKEYLIQFRMEKAKEHFRSTNFNIGQVAERVGYKDKKYFSKLFEKQVGIKPKEYKRIYG